MNKLFIKFILIVLISTALVASTNLVSITTEEFSDFRRILIQYPFKMDGSRNFPMLSEEPAKGTFFIDLSLNDSAGYFGPKLIQESGRYPVRARYQRIDATKLRFSFETIPFEKVISWYVLGSEQFIFDIYKILPVESSLMEKTVGFTSLYKNKKPKLKINKTGNLTFKEKALYFVNDSANKPLLNKAMLFASFILIILLIFFLFVQLHTRNLIKQQKINGKPLAPVKTNKKIPKKNIEKIKIKEAADSPPEKISINPDADLNIPDLKTPEDRDRAIRDLMGQQNISYDEAAMMLMMKSG
ncbi:MAG: hypothetical protein KAI81_02500, partial [Candidatus Marinimicrobia bacterium]|nr:hypothetical protein [Candidatus Neomarinimicrobiota bacterium]